MCKTLVLPEKDNKFNECDDIRVGKWESFNSLLTTLKRLAQTIKQ